MASLTFSVVVVDEAHRMKQPKALLSLAVKKIPCRSCFALTGTLIQNRMEEMWSVLDFVRKIATQLIQDSAWLGRNFPRMA